MTTFGLVHGAGHGAWCWERLIPELEDRGHRAIAMDLPAQQLDADWDDYADAVAIALEGTDQVVLVGHSLGGLTIPLVAARRPVERLVYLCAAIPRPGRSALDDGGRGDPPYTLIDPAAMVADANGAISFTADGAKHALYHDCDEALADWAVARLRPQASMMMTHPCPLAHLPEVASSYVLCTGDRAINPAWSRQAAQSQLGVIAIEMPGSHSPFLSRPVHLAQVLCALG